MTTITVDIEQKLNLFREDIIPTLERNIETLDRISTASYAPGTEDAIRCTAKAAALRKVITEQGERLVNVKTENDVFTLAAMINMAGDYDGAHKEGTALAVKRMVDYMR